MLAILSYFVLALFLGGSLYIIGLMIYLVLKKKNAHIKPLDPKGVNHPDLPKAA